MNAILLSLLIAAAVVLCAVAALVALIFWIASGEPDVNGDPERDAGLLPERRPLWRSSPPPAVDETDFIECEVVCCACGRHIVGPAKDIFGRPTLKVTDLCVRCAVEKRKLVAAVGEVQRV